MKVLFYLAHPAHFHLFKNVIHSFQNRFGTVKVLIQKKDILQKLTEKQGLHTENILEKGRKDGLFYSALSVLKKDLKILRVARNYKPDILISSAPEVAHVARLIGRPSILVFEDDLDQVKLYQKIGPPYASTLLVPQTTRVGKFEHKTIRYQSYHELAYLHPNTFQPDKSKIKHLIKNDKPFFIIRFSKLSAYHDIGRSGITEGIAKNIVEILKDRGNIYITSEKEMLPEFKKYQIPLPSEEMHHAMYYSSLYIGDSQTMAAEAAVLGTPSLRFNDFVGKLSYLEDLEHNYGLTYGIKTSNVKSLYHLIDKLSKTPNGTKDEWHKKKNKMLEQKIDLSAFLNWFFENYPRSVSLIKNNPEVQYLLPIIK